MDTSTLFTNVRILDGTGAMPYAGSVLVQGNRIRTVGRSSAALAPNGATVIDGAGATLMPGMCEAHTHFSWNDAATLAGIQTMPLEEHVLWCAKIAKKYLEAGWTSCVGAAVRQAAPRRRHPQRDQLGPDPGAALPRRQPGDHRSRRARRRDAAAPAVPEFSFGVNVNSPDEMRKAVRMFLKYGVDSIKLNLSGDNFTPDSPADTNWMSDARSTRRCRR
jgi:imidazolonepropionase-like amidohydrolase